MCTGFTALAEETTKNDSPFSILFQPFTCHFSAISEKENHRDRPWASPVAHSGPKVPEAMVCSTAGWGRIEIIAGFSLVLHEFSLNRPVF